MLKNDRIHKSGSAGNNHDTLILDDMIINNGNIESLILTGVSEDKNAFKCGDVIWADEDMNLQMLSIFGHNLGTAQFKITKDCDAIDGRCIVDIFPSISIDLVNNVTNRPLKKLDIFYAFPDHIVSIHLAKSSLFI